MKQTYKIMAILALIGAGACLQALDDQDSAGTGIGSITTEVNVAVCTAVGGAAKIEQGAFTETNKLTSESMTTDKRLDLNVSGGPAACGDVIVGSLDPATGKTDGSATKTNQYTQTSGNRSKRGSKRSVGDVSTISTTQYDKLVKEATELSLDGISTTLPAVNTYKAFIITTLGNETLLLKATAGAANKYTITFYINRPSYSKNSIELLEIANMVIKGVANLEDINIYLQEGNEGTVGVRANGIEFILPNKVPFENFSHFNATKGPKPLR